MFEPLPLTAFKHRSSTQTAGEAPQQMQNNENKHHAPSQSTPVISTPTVTNIQDQLPNVSTHDLLSELLRRALSSEDKTALLTHFDLPTSDPMTVEQSDLEVYWKKGWEVFIDRLHHESLGLQEQLQTDLRRQLDEHLLRLIEQILPMTDPAKRQLISTVDETLEEYFLPISPKINLFLNPADYKNYHQRFESQQDLSWNPEQKEKYSWFKSITVKTDGKLLPNQARLESESQGYFIDIAPWIEHLKQTIQQLILKNKSSSTSL